MPNALRPVLVLVLILAASLRAASPFEPFDPGAVPRGATNLKVEAVLNQTQLQPNAQVVVALVIDVPAGFYAQSNTPIESGGFKPIPMTVSIGANPAFKAFAPQFPKPQEKAGEPPVDRISFFSDRVVVYVPIQVAQTAAEGPLTISGTVGYQICDKKGVCLQPDEAPFTVTATVTTSPIRGGPTTSRAIAGLFDNFDWNRFFSAEAKPAVTHKSIFGRIDSLWLGLVAAFVVGIVFNVVPCVLPVVPLKALSFYEVSRHSRARSVALASVFSLGIIATFGALALLVLVFKSFTWGELFDRAWFSIVISGILIVMALGTFGLFNFLLPTSIYSLAPRHDTYGGNFLFGILTAVLSTPCTFGMFAGILAWAASQPKAVGVSILMVAGAGMAFPYLVLSFIPELARRMPRTGPWSELVKQSMAFLLLGAALFFLGRFFPLYRWHAIFGVAAAMTLFLLVRTLMLSRRPWIGIPVVLLLCAPLLYITFPRPELIHWTPYSQQALEKARGENRIVMVEFTASWCSNCILIENSVFRDKVAADAIEKHGVVTLRADVTDTSAPGKVLLKELNPVGGIPLTVIYHPGKAEPEFLQGIYQTADLVGAIEKKN